MTDDAISGSANLRADGGETAKSSVDDTDRLYDALHTRVEEFREAGFEPDRIVVPGEDWRGVKERAEVLEGEGFAGGDKTVVNGVRVTYSTTLGTARVVFKEGDSS